MLQTNFCAEREAIIARATAPLASDLRLVDIEYLIAFITLQMHNHVADHVQSAAERHYTPGFITTGNGCEVSVSWERVPEVKIDLVMNLEWAKAYFTLQMNAESALVRLEHFSSAVSLTGGQGDIRKLQASIQSMTLPNAQG